MNNIPRIVIAAPARSAGKTTVTIGLLRAFTRTGVAAQGFKKGPDFIDPMWASAASGRACRNLDFHMMGDENILRSFSSASTGADIAIIEGNLGLYDGLDLEGADSTAGLAHLLGAPVILVVDAWGINRGVAALLTGYMKFDPGLRIAGVILNRVSGARHETKLRQSIERFVGLPVLGVIPRAQDKMVVRERHLGLVPVKEDPGLLEKVELIGDVVGRNCDLDRIRAIASAADELPDLPPCPRPGGSSDIRIGLAMDRAFNFYYPENLEALQAAGAELVPFSPLDDTAPPDVNGIYIGGGFPEMFASELEANGSMRRALREHIESGLPVYAECGGLMYLCRSISWEGQRCAMAGVIPADVEMTRKPQGLGYVVLAATGACDWFTPSEPVKCHEFHHSRLIGLPEDTRFAWRTVRGAGINGEADGIVYKNLLAGYAHLHSCGAPSWAKSFTAHVRKTGYAISRKNEEMVKR